MAANKIIQNFQVAFAYQTEQKLQSQSVMKIADHIVDAEQVHDQSSFYKAKRRGGGYVAVQIFPFQLTGKRYQLFEEQISLLIKAFEEYNAAVPRVLNHGLTKSGSFPFIEMEWIEGDDLIASTNKTEKLSIEEISKIAEQVSSVLTHCYNLKLVHGNISESNILWHGWRKRYVLTGFRFGVTEKESPSFRQNPALFEREHKKDVHDLGMVLLQLTRMATDVPGDLRSPGFQSPGQETVPEWLITVIEKCITKSKESFRHAGEVYDYILQYYKAPLQKDWYRSQPQQPVPATSKAYLKNDKGNSWKKFFRLPKLFKNKIEGIRFVPDRQLLTGLIVAVLLAGFGIYAQRKEKNKITGFKDVSADNQTLQLQAQDQIMEEDIQRDALPAGRENNKATKTSDKNTSGAKSGTDAVQKPKPPAQEETDSYKVRSKAFFYNQPDESSRRDAFIVHWNNAVLHPLKEENDFVYIVFTNHEGQTSKGWLRKKDLTKL